MKPGLSYKTNPAVFAFFKTRVLYFSKRNRFLSFFLEKHKNPILNCSYCIGQIAPFLELHDTNLLLYNSQDDAVHLMSCNARLRP